VNTIYKSAAIVKRTFNKTLREQPVLDVEHFLNPEIPCDPEILQGYKTGHKTIR